MKLKLLRVNQRLKLFEEYNNDNYYQLLDVDDFLDAEYDRIEMSDKTINRIKQAFVGWDIEVGYLNEFIYMWDFDPNADHEIKIFEVDDEYFYCYINNYNQDITDYYKCDQLEGLIKLFKDKELI